MRAGKIRVEDFGFKDSRIPVGKSAGLLLPNFCICALGGAAVRGGETPPLDIYREDAGTHRRLV
jgi:hypothetical protein